MGILKNPDSAKDKDKKTVSFKLQTKTKEKTPPKIFKPIALCSVVSKPQLFEKSCSISSSNFQPKLNESRPNSPNYPRPRSNSNEFKKPRPISPNIESFSQLEMNSETFKRRQENWKKFKGKK
jgi:hypothetical protein